jgi:cell division protein FtsL
MLLRGLNLILIGLIIILSIKLIKQRYEIRVNENNLAQLKKEADNLEKEYSRLEIEFGTYSSNLVLKEFAMKRLQLTKPEDKQLMEVDSNVSKK